MLSAQVRAELVSRKVVFYTKHVRWSGRSLFHCLHSMLLLPLARTARLAIAITCLSVMDMEARAERFLVSSSTLIYFEMLSTSSYIDIIDGKMVIASIS